MGALPKRKPSTHRQGRRRSQLGLTAPRPVACFDCGGLKLPQLACPHCGSWGKTDEKRNKKAKNRSQAPKKKKGR